MKLHRAVWRSYTTEISLFTVDKYAPPPPTSVQHNPDLKKSVIVSLLSNVYSSQLYFFQAIW